MSELMVSVSGIRGIWGDSLTLDSLSLYTRSFGNYLLERGEKKVLMGRDARPTGGMIADHTASILNAMGIDVDDCGIVPTPTVLFGVRKRAYGGGIIITASHNPAEWNALKFVKKGGVFTGEKDVKEIKEGLGKKIKEAPYDRVGSHRKDDSVSATHVEEVVKNTDASVIRNRKFKVVLDPVNSAGSDITRLLLEKLGCETVVVNGEMNGKFGRGTEPTPANLTHLGPVIRDHRADAGFAQDPDADRLVLVDEKGRVLSEEWTLALAVESVLSKKNGARGAVVTNVSTSMVTESIAKKYSCEHYHTKVGEANVSEGIDLHHALIGGEGNGGVIYPTINQARDSLVGIALVLELMARTGKKLSELADGLPQFTMMKEKIQFHGDLVAGYNALKKEFASARTDTQDGLRLDWEENGAPLWVHVRPSNTEPVVRIIGESSDRKVLEKAVDRVRKIVKSSGEK
jgi:phosphomannomutase